MKNQLRHKVSATVEVELAGEDIDDIMVCALEGGINYWCIQAEVVGEYRGEFGSEQISRDGAIILHDAADKARHELTLEKFLKGIKLYIEKVEPLPTDGKRVDPGQIDAIIADAIIQLAIFDEVIYS